MPTFVDPAKPFYVEIEQSELTSLRARVARLEEALKEIVDEYEHPTGCVINGAEMGQIARRALEEK